MLARLQREQWAGEEEEAAEAAVVVGMRLDLLVLSEEDQARRSSLGALWESWVALVTSLVPCSELPQACAGFSCPRDHIQLGPGLPQSSYHA